MAITGTPQPGAVTQATPAVKAAAAGDEAAVIAALTVAFSADPITRWLYPSPHQYLTHFPSLLRAFAGQAFAHGTADYTEDGIGVALWLPPNVQPDEEQMVALLQESVAEAQQEMAFAVLEQMGHSHPSEPHWYLPVIGVDLPRQGKGYGSALLRHALVRCDRQGAPAYLESSSPANVPLYERHGFEVVRAIQIGTAPTMWPMVRRPR